MRVPGVLVLLSALAVVTACTGETVPAPTSTEPAGALYGHVRSADGDLVTDADVRLYQLTREDNVRTGMAVLSLGLFCLAEDFCPAPVNAELSSEGFYVFPKRVMKDSPDLTLSATRPDGDRGLSGATTSVNLRDGKDPQPAPELTLWEPELDVDQRGTRARVRWSGLSGAAHGPDLAYTSWARALTDRAGMPQRVSAPSKGTGTTIDLRPYEDQPTELTVLAGTKASVDGQETQLAYRSPGRELPMAGAPPSRDRPCLTDNESGELVPTERPCVLTDGDLADHEEVLAKGECPVDERKCQPVSHQRACVDLGENGRAGLVVVRTPFPSSDIRVELSQDGQHFDAVGAVGAEEEISAVPVRPARSAKLVCLRGDFGGSILRELSVWP